MKHVNAQTALFVHMLTPHCCFSRPGVKFLDPQPKSPLWTFWKAWRLSGERGAEMGVKIERWRG